MHNIYFTRHGETVWNVENKICGMTDSPLTAHGQEQARQLADIRKRREEALAMLKGRSVDAPLPAAGYQLPIAITIFRGRYREDFAVPKPLQPGVAQAYTFDLPNVNHVLKPGHRLMVQIQSSLFPLYDRNPQAWVDNIFFAKPGDYRKATQRIWATPQQASLIELPVVSGALP